MTVLCIRSIRKNYPDITNICVLYDDLCTSWPDYAKDCERLYVEASNIIPYSRLAGINRCQVGWWRAQLIKLHVDLMLPGNEWFVIDGDVIFDDKINVEYRTPYSTHANSNDSILDSMVNRYVDRMLGRVNSRFRIEPWPMVVTSCIPFRWLSRSQLASLRQYVERVNNQKSFLDWHCDMFLSQDIVGFVPEGDRMVMHEWELIEAWNQLDQPGRYQPMEASAGYHTLTHTSNLKSPKFRHSSLRDRDIGRIWFEHQSVPIDNALWARISHA